MQEELIELQRDGFARNVYSERNLSDFWFTICKSYKRIAEPAIQALLLFPSTWLYESTFSMLRGIKSKYRSQLKTPEHDLRCSVANVLSRINELVAKMQAHSSHWLELLGLFSQYIVSLTVVFVLAWVTLL